MIFKNKLGVCIIFFLLLFVGFANAEFTDGLIMRLKLEKNITDFQGNYNWTNVGVSFSNGWAIFNYSEQDYLYHSNNFLRFADDITICFMLEMDTLELGSIYHTGYNQGQINLLFWDTFGYRKIELNGGGSALYSYTDTLSLGEKYSHCVIISSDGYGAIYKNGIKKAQDTFNLVDADTHYIGKYGTYYLGAKLKEFCVWNRVLTEDEILIYHNQEGCMPYIYLDIVHNLENNTIIKGDTININLSLSTNSLNSFTCNLLIDGEIKTTRTDIYNNDTFTYKFDEGGVYILGLKCYNSEIEEETGGYKYVITGSEEVKIETSISWFWLLLVFALSFPFIIRSMNGSRDKDMAIFSIFISLLIFVLLFIVLVTDFLTLGQLTFYITVFILMFLIIYAIWLFEYM